MWCVTGAERDQPFEVIIISKYPAGYESASWSRFEGVMFFRQTLSSDFLCLPVTFLRLLEHHVTTSAANPRKSRFSISS